MNYSHLAVAFRKPKAKIDFIKTVVPSVLLTEPKLAMELQKAIQGRIEVPKRHSDNWITIHDPSIADLQWMLDHVPEAPVLAIEIAVDWQLADGRNDPDQLMVLHSWFNHCLFPQRHAELHQAKRHRYSHQSDKYERDNLETLGGDTTFQWRDNKQKMRVRLYRKSLDNKKPLTGQHSVRLEATLERGACQEFDLHRIAELPQFADRMRRELSDCFFVAEGIKPKIRQSRAKTPAKAQKALREAEAEQRRVEREWERYGAQWAAKHGYEAQPDTEATRAIGVALKRLREKMLPLKLTQKVAEKPCYAVLTTPVSIEVVAGDGALPISGSSNPPTQSSASDHRKDHRYVTLPLNSPMQQAATVDECNDGKERNHKD